VIGWYNLSMRRYPAISELRKRDLCWVAELFVTVPLVALFVMVYQAAEVPTKAWIMITVLASIDLLLAAILLFPRSYLVLDRKRGIATFVNRKGREEIPIADLEPLYIRKVSRTIRSDRFAGDRQSIWFRVESAAAPVCFYRGVTRRAASKRLERLKRKLGFSRTGPSKTEYLPSVDGGE
jgi:hypothetical protein